jgi:hypothetical protein
LGLFPVCCILKTGLDVSSSKVWEIIDNIARRHSRRQVIKHIINRNSHIPYTRLSPSLTRFNGYYILIIYHTIIIASRFENINYNYVKTGKPGDKELEFVVDKVPAKAGIDPYYFLVDKHTEDNVVEIEK